MDEERDPSPLERGTSEHPGPDLPDFGSPDFGSPDFGSPDLGSPDFGSADVGATDSGAADPAVTRSDQQHIDAFRSELFFGDFAPPLDPDLVFECAASMNGEQGGVMLYGDRLTIESPDEPGGSVDLDPATVRSWWTVVDGSFFSFVVDADVLHRTRLPLGFKAVLVAAFTKALGPAAEPPATEPPAA